VDGSGLIGTMSRAGLKTCAKRKLCYYKESDPGHAAVLIRKILRSGAKITDDAFYILHLKTSFIYYILMHLNRDQGCT
jgi:hypothetical protein